MRSNATLGHLHWVIQFAMGWTDSHLHSFSIRGVEYTTLMPDLGFDELDMRDEQPVKLSKVISSEKFKFFYTYNFGDSWKHEVLVEKVLTAETAIGHPTCIKAKRACPPEDCGGTWGYQEFPEAIKDSERPEHESMLKWVGGSFDPEEAELDEINMLLKTIPHDMANFNGYIP